MVNTFLELATWTGVALAATAVISLVSFIWGVMRQGDPFDDPTDGG